MTRSFWAGLVLGATLSAAAIELPYVNWHPVVPPVDGRPLLIRQDAKGDGRYLSRRSGDRRHQGIDLSAALDSPVRAIRSGRVVDVGSD
jgi:murein DD-endopeptidase MepM/ murein hydrolase activator NlpD